jgi:hypothetical protein
MTIAYLYRITYIPDGKCYHGTTWSKNGKTPNDRFQEHLAGRGSVHIKRLLEKGASETDFVLECLMISTPEFCRDMEQCLCKDSIIPNGLNGNCGRNIILDEISIEKMKKSKKGKALPPFSKSHRKIISDNKKKWWAIKKDGGLESHFSVLNQERTGIPLSQEHRDNISKGCSGRVLSDEHKRRISESLKGKPLSEERKLKISISHQKRKQSND